jgi:PAS domain S-box-containing protein
MSTSVNRQQALSRSLTFAGQTPDLYQQIFAHSNTPVAIMDKEGHYVAQNSAHYELLGYADEELEGTSPAIHMGQETFALVTRELVETGEFRGEITSQTKSGDIKQIELSAFSVRNAAGELVCYVGIKRDISERKRADEALRRSETELAHLLLRERAARAEAEQANRLKDEFLATVSHELRTPLNAIMGWSRMMRSGKLDAAGTDHALEVVERNALAQKQIIEDILDVSRVITGKLQLNRSPVNLSSVIDAAFDAVRPALEAKEILVTKQIEPDARMISGDPDRLQQVVWNLLSNAAKFTPEGGDVVIDLRQRGNCLQLQVSDSGPGIDPDFLPYVFERFRQEDGSTTRTHGGLGLGLAIVRHLVELHGGAIRAENNKGGAGAIFTVSLPLPSGALSMEDLPGAFPKDMSSPATEIPNLSGISVLVVDDEADALDLITVELTNCGARVRAYLSAAEALAALEKSDYDLVISDIGMPEQDGYQFIRQVRTGETGVKARKIPAVALTGHARAQDRMRALIAGYDTHVAKPIETNELLTVVASLVGRLVK